ncbi:MAG: iron-sulfur cluster assembly accessory protein [Elusimicrobiota bacterium]
MVTMTENAAGKIREFITVEPQAKGKSLRIAVEPGGCSGYQYAFSFDEKKSNDTEVPFQGFSVLIDERRAGYLQGSSIDYADDASSSGFKIANPNVKKSCGCGQSNQF